MILIPERPKNIEKIPAKKLFEISPYHYHMRRLAWAQRQRRHYERAETKRKHHAKHMVSKAIEDGLIRRPTHCTLCRSHHLRFSDEQQLNGHHWRGYADERVLDVMWVCRQCHDELHSNSGSHPVRMSSAAEDTIRRRHGHVVLDRVLGEAHQWMKRNANVNWHPSGAPTVVYTNAALQALIYEIIKKEND